MTTYGGFSLLSSAVCMLLLCQGSLGQLPFGQGRQPRQQAERREWRLERLEAVEPSRRKITTCRKNPQMAAAGEFPLSWSNSFNSPDTTIEPRGLVLPYYSNAPRLVYVIQGRGIGGLVYPGCPFQPSQSREQGREQESRDQHQKIQRFREGDVIAIPAGVASWSYNDGDSPIVAVTVTDTRNFANQLDQRLRRFELAGSQQRRESYEGESAGGEASSAGNVFRGLDEEVIAEAFGINRETASKLQGLDDRRGNIVRRSYEQQEEEEEERKRRDTNGLEEALCNIKHRENIRKQASADLEGSPASTNSHYALHWNINAHSILYVTRGRARLQISENQGEEFRQRGAAGQIVVIPQNFVVTAQAGNEGFEWVSFKTEDNALVSPLVGKASVFRGIPANVIASSCRVSNEETKRIKYGRGEEFLVFRPRAQTGRSTA
ncbi:unnamed protein product [Spirodela intermedia]|uniref:Cupin type-1 domain-containing protein n=1 Tax=Spirodela intermedia TaxID=51605 RepID=A0A7I8IWV6_SPIIN|nr:unnamed protein product [Spirodela intermedia]CAA6662474.1 unnamed protein product [Spirodela intermedia]